jgi:hypothetical protein
MGESEEKAKIPFKGLLQKETEVCAVSFQKKDGRTNL